MNLWTRLKALQRSTWTARERDGDGRTRAPFPAGVLAAPLLLGVFSLMTLRDPGVEPGLWATGFPLRNFPRDAFLLAVFLALFVAPALTATPRALSRRDAVVRIVEIVAAQFAALLPVVVAAGGMRAAGSATLPDRKSVV